MSKWIIGTIILVIILAGVVLLYNNSKNATKIATQASPSSANQNEVNPTSQASATQSASTNSTSVKEFTVTGSNFSFSPSTITVNQGDTVKVTFKSAGGLHDIVFPDFNVQSQVIQTGSTATIQFVANKSGSFEYFCSVSNHRAMGMKGTLIVK